MLALGGCVVGGFWAVLPLRVPAARVWPLVRTGLRVAPPGPAALGAAAVRVRGAVAAGRWADSQST